MWTFEEIYKGALTNIIEANSVGVYKVFVPNNFPILFSYDTDAKKDVNNIKSVELLKKALGNNSEFNCRRGEKYSLYRANVQNFKKTIG